MDKPRDDLAYRKINRLTAIQLASTSMVILVIAIVAILQSGRSRQLLHRVERLEGRIERLERDASVGALPIEESPTITPPNSDEKGDERNVSHQPPSPADAGGIDEESSTPAEPLRSPGSLEAQEAAVRLAAGDFEGCVEKAQGAIGAGAEGADIGVVLGRGLLGQGDLAGATDALRAVIVQHPDDYAAWFYLGTARLASLDSAGAASAFEEAVRIDPESADSWHRLGVARANGDQAAEAEAAFRTCVTLDPGFASAHFARAICQARLGDAVAAEASLVLSLALDATLMEQAERVPVLAALLAEQSHGATSGASGSSPLPDGRGSQNKGPSEGQPH